MYKLDKVGSKTKTVKSIGLNEKLTKGIIKAFKWALKNRKGKGLSGSGFAGAGFFSDFAKGFKSVFKPGAKILGPIASTLGVPEIGIPLSIAGDLL